MFNVDDRERIRKASARNRSGGRAGLSAGAVVGSLALSEGDRWSDLDLTFASGRRCLRYRPSWRIGTRKLAEEFGAIQLFDLPSGPSIYRVFLLPGCLQFDLSFTPGPSFGATGPEV